ncbi:MAG: rhodanese-like domain-containing protein [Spongiibacteraceae bacterium]
MKSRSTILIGLALIIVACSGEHATSTISAQELVTRINNNSAPLVLDVRTIDEYNGGHIPGAINIPFDQFQLEFDELKLAKKTEIVIYSETGYRSGKAEKDLKKQGYFEVRSLYGDIKRWRKLGFMLE